MVQWPTLIGIAGGCGIGLGCMTLLLRKQVERVTNQSTFLKSAIDIMESQPAVMQLLGENRVIGRASLDDGFTKLGVQNVQVRVPVKGDNDTAQLYAYAFKSKVSKKYKLNKLEMTFEKIKGKRMILFESDVYEDDLEPPPPEEQKVEKPKIKFDKIPKPHNVKNVLDKQHDATK